MRKTACTARHATSRTRCRTSYGLRPKAAAGRITPTCKQESRMRIALRLSCLIIVLEQSATPLPVHDFLEPETSDHGFDVAYFSFAHPRQQLFDGSGHGFQKFALIELGFAGPQAARNKNIQMLVRIGNRVMDSAEKLPIVGAVAGFLSQFTLRAKQRIFTGIDFTGREFQEYLVGGIAELSLKQHGAVIKQRQDYHRAGMTDIFSHGLFTVRQTDTVAPDLEEVSFISERSFDQGFFQMLIHAVSDK